ncbi:MAG: response regulator, partial [Planctomycetes bacterium]|nr:response regulator [Planctomycetota bacterium]
IRQTVWELAISHPSAPSSDRITVSIGVASHERGTLERAILRADRALYRAKDAGRNRVFATEAPGTIGDIPADHPTEQTRHTRDDPVHVLVADDNPTNRLIYKRTLEREGYDVREAADGAAALAAIAESPPDVIIMDVMMPRVDGLECTRRLKADPATRDIPVIVVSAKAQEEDILAGLEAGANEYLTKPVRAAELALRVGSMATYNRNRVELLNQYTEITRSNEVRGEQARALSTLLTLSRGLATATSCASVFRQIITATAELTGCRRISIMLPDKTGEYLTIVDSVGMASSIADSVRVPIGSAISGKVFATGRAVVANTPDEDSSSENHYDSEFFVSTPLASKALTATERSVGVLNITDRLEGRAFCEDELEYLDVLCNLAGAAINSLRSAEARDAALDSIVIALATLAEHRDTDTGLHLDRVTRFVLLLANDLRQAESFGNVIDDAYLDDLKRAIPLHDIGKVAIPDAILLKPGKLTVEEMDTIKRHPEYGVKTIRPIMERAPDARFLKMAELIALSHHEWYDGSGYPRELVGEDIPLAARIAAVADVYDALTTRRSYKEAFPHEKALRMIREESGTHFDPLVVEAFLRCEREFAQLAEELRDELNSREDTHSYQS